MATRLRPDALFTWQTWTNQDAYETDLSYINDKVLEIAHILPTDNMELNIQISLLLGKIKETADRMKTDYKVVE